MRISIFISLIISYSSLAYSQNVSSYANPATTVYTIDKLPSVIQLKLNSLLSVYLGKMESSVYFIDAQIADLDKFLKETNVAPKYNVHYYISIPSMGLKKYDVVIRLDQYGQLIYIKPLPLQQQQGLQIRQAD